jgi:hypothetical protein
MSAIGGKADICPELLRRDKARQIAAVADSATYNVRNR